MPRSTTREKRREQILEGLFAAMARDGTRGASISEIAESAGIARGALHYYFSSKEEIRVSLMRHLGDRYIDGLSRHVTRFVDEGAEPERLANALVRYHLAGDDDHTARLLGVWIDFWGSAPSEGALHEVVLDVQERARHVCARVIVAMRSELTLLPSDELRARAATVLALIEGALLQWRIALRTARELEKRALSSALADAVVALVDAVPHPTAARVVEAHRIEELHHAARE